MGSIKDRLLKKIKTQFPHIPIPIGVREQLHRVYGVDDGVRFKWSNFGINETCIFSYYTMSDCLKHEITAEYFRALDGGHSGWIINLVEIKKLENVREPDEQI